MFNKAMNSMKDWAIVSQGDFGLDETNALKKSAKGLPDARISLVLQYFACQYCILL